MPVINLYITSAIVKATLMVWFVFIALSVLFGFLGELDVVTPSYNSYAAFMYAVLISAQFAAKIFPLSLLVGMVFAIGKLSDQNELIVIFASGVAVTAILKTILIVGSVLLILVMIFAEILVPRAELKARQLVSSTTNKTWFNATKYGAWMIQGDKFFHIQDMKTTQNANNLSIFTYQGIDLTQIKHADHAYLKNNGVWLLFGVTTTDFTANQLLQTKQSNDQINSNIEADVVIKMQILLDKLSSMDLLTQRNFLLANNLEVSHIEQELWRRLAYPFSALVMLFFTFPLILKSNRTVTLSQKVFSGIILAIVFFVFSQIIEQLGLVMGIATWINIWSPILLFLVIGFNSYRKLRHS